MADTLPAIKKSVSIPHEDGNGRPQGEESCDVTTVQTFRQDARRGKAPFELWKYCKCDGKKKEEKKATIKTKMDQKSIPQNRLHSSKIAARVLATHQYSHNYLRGP